MLKKTYAMFYNHSHVGDVLLIVFDEAARPNEVIKNGDVVFLKKDGEVVGINIFNIGSVMKIKANGLIPIVSDEILNVINSILKNAGFEELPKKDSSGFKIAKIVEIDEHPDSEHLHICDVDVGEEKTLQIVCGAANARKDLLCVCAMPLTFMPNGKQIVPGKLLGIESNGMLCSGRELGLEGYENKRGLLELDPSEYKVGEDFFLK